MACTKVDRDLKFTVRLPPPMNVNETRKMGDMPRYILHEIRKNIYSSPKITYLQSNIAVLALEIIEEKDDLTDMFV